MSPPRWSSTKRLSRANWKLPSTLLAACTTSTLNRSTRNSGRERSGASRMRLLPHSRNWIPSRSSRRQPSWESSWKHSSRSRSDVGRHRPGRPFVLHSLDHGRHKVRSAGSPPVWISSFPPNKLKSLDGASRIELGFPQSIYEREMVRAIRYGGVWHRLLL